MYEAKSTRPLSKYDHAATIERLKRVDDTVHSGDIPCRKERQAFIKWCLRRRHIPLCDGVIKLGRPGRGD